MREKQIEQKLVQAVKNRGGMALKFMSPGFVGVPDRLILIPDGKVGFVEVKAPGQKMRPLQEKRKSQLESFGFLVFCIDSIEEIGVVLDQLGGGAR